MDADLEEYISLIFDIGTFNYKIGYSGDREPLVNLDPYIGINKQNNLLYSNDEIFNYKQNDIKAFTFLSKLNGSLENFDLFEAFLDNILSNILIKKDNKTITNHPFLFSEPILHNKESRIKLTQLMFETYQIPYLFICKNSLLSSFSFGRNCCLILDSGHNFCTSSVVFDGIVLKNGLKFINNEKTGSITNKIILNYLKIDCNLDLNKNYYFDFDKLFQNYIFDYKILHDIKYKIIENDNNNMLSYKLPDGKIIDININEIKNKLNNHMFNDKSSLNSIVYNTINESNLENKKELFSNICVCGGNTLMYNDINQRIENYLINRATKDTFVKVITHPNLSERTISSWLGASILTSLNTFVENCMTKEEFEEHGAATIEKKCA